MAKGKPVLKCAECSEAVYARDEVVLDGIYAIVHDRCGKQELYGEIDKGQFFEVVARHYPYFQKVVHELNRQGYYN